LECLSGNLLRTAGMVEPISLGEPVGEKPYVEVLLMPMLSNDLVNPSGYLGTIGRKSHLGCLRKKLQAHLGVSEAALSEFVTGGKSLDDCKTLEENGMILPGPAARRRGEKLELMFDLSDIVLKQEQREAADALEKQRLKELREAEAAKKKAELAVKQREQDAFWKGGGAEEGLQKFVEQNIGISRSLSMALKSSDPDFEEPSSFFEQCSAEQMKALECLLQGTGLPQAEVVMALRNDHGELRERFERSKHSLCSGCKIPARKSATLKVMDSNRSIEAALGECDRHVNEFLLFHGTPKVEAVRNICKSGFDIHYVGTTTDAGWYGAGFYFGDRAELSHGYGRAAVHVNEKYPQVHILIVNRVVVGKVKVVDTVVSDEERERMTADCLGPGGVFGPTAQFHSVLGGHSSEYVCMSSRQIYPEFVVLYSCKAD